MGRQFWWEEGVPLVSSGPESGVLLDTLQYTRQAPAKKVLAPNVNSTEGKTPFPAEAQPSPASVVG